MPKPITGSWDALDEAMDALNQGGLTFVLTVGMSGSGTYRTRTNAWDAKSFKWLHKRNAKHCQQMLQNFDK